MKLICGLGNPGKKYERTRHNAGFLALDAVAKKLAAGEFKKHEKFKSEIAEAGEDLLVKPMTYMNNSGEALCALARYYKVHPSNVWVLYDDIDLPLGTIRVRRSGGPGTHNGMKSIIQQLGTRDFPRFRIGIESRIPEHGKDLHDFVLGLISNEEMPLFEKSLERVSDAVLGALKSDIKTAMETYNGSK